MALANKEHPVTDPKDTPADELVRVYTVKNANQAEIVKNFLESEGIFCGIEGEGQVGLAGILDIKLLVRAADADRARELIAQHEQSGQESDEGDWDDEEGEGAQ
jgi:hypothetical protein